MLGGGGDTGKQVDTGERFEARGVNGETVQSTDGSTREHTCSGLLSVYPKLEEVMCAICEACSVYAYVRVCVKKLLNCREKGNVLVFTGGMAQYGGIDQSRWTSNSYSCNTLPPRLYVVMCTVNNNSINEESAEY